MSDSMDGFLIYQAVIPMVTIRNENSLICPNEIPVRKLFFLACPKNPRIIMVMMGFIINTNITKTISGSIMERSIVAKFTCDPRSTKNNTMKKSLSGLILLVISNLYDEPANVTPATNVPISIPNPIRWNNAPKMKHRPMENRNKYSCDSAIFLVIIGIKYLLIPTRPTPNPITLAIMLTIARADDHPPIFFHVPIHRIKSITIRSCTISIPILSLP